MILKPIVVPILVVTLAWLVGCTDVPSNGPAPPEVNSEFRFLNADPDIASTDISFDLGPVASGLAFQQPNDHTTYPAGNRVGVMSGTNDTLRIAMTTDQRATIVIMPLTDTFRDIRKLVERRIFDPATTATARIRVMHAALDSGSSAGDLDVAVAGSDTTVTVSGLNYASSTSYLDVPPGSYKIDIFAAGDTNVVLSTTLNVSASRYTSVLTGDISVGTAAFVDMADN